MGVPHVVCREAFPALISPPSRYCKRGFRSAACVTAVEIAKKDTFPGMLARGRSRAVWSQVHERW